MSIAFQIRALHDLKDQWFWKNFTSDLVYSDKGLSWLEGLFPEEAECFYLYPTPVENIVNVEWVHNDWDFSLHVDIKKYTGELKAQKTKGSYTGTLNQFEIESYTGIFNEKEIIELFKTKTVLIGVGL